MPQVLFGGSSLSAPHAIEDLITFEFQIRLKLVIAPNFGSVAKPSDGGSFAARCLRVGPGQSAHINWPALADDMQGSKSKRGDASRASGTRRVYHHQQAGRRDL